MRFFLLGLSFVFVTYYALHHGSYSLIDRQQIAVYVWVAIGIAAIFGALPAVRPPKILLIPLFALLGMALWSLIALTWTESAERTFAEFGRIVGYLGVMVLIWIGVGRNSWRLVAAGLLSAGVVVTYLLVLSRFWPSAFPSDTVAESFKTTRINYPFGYWNAVGAWCAMTATLCLSYGAHARSGVVRALALGSVPVCAIGLYLALSRAGFGGAILGAIVVVLLAQWRWLTFFQTLLAVAASLAAILALRGHPELVNATGSGGAWSMGLVLAGLGALLGCVAWAGAKFSLGERLRMPASSGRKLGIAGGLLAVIAIVFAAASFGPEAYDEFTGGEWNRGPAGAARLTVLNGNRYNAWESGWHAFEAHPVGGTGPGTFEFWWSRDAVNWEFLRDAHNIYVEALAETGIVGFVLLLSFLVGLIVVALVARRGIPRASSGAVGINGGLLAVFAVFLLQAGVDWLWESTAITIFALVAAAVAGAAASETRREGAGAMLPLGLALASVLAVIILMAGLANARQIERSQAAFRAGDGEAALEHANAAINAQRWSATAWAQRALALEELGNYDEALEAIQVAQAKEPYNWRWPLVSAKIYVEIGEPTLAAEQTAKARSLRPLAALFDPRR